MTGSWCEGRAMLLALCKGFVGPGACWQGSQSLQGCALWRAEQHRRDGCSGGGCSLLYLVSLHWLGRRAENCQRNTCHIPGTHHLRSLSSRNLLHFVAPDQLPYKAKMSQHGSARTTGQAGAQAECGCLLPALTLLSRKRLQWGRPDLSHTWTGGREIQAGFFSVDYRDGEAGRAASVTSCMTQAALN